MEIDGKDAAFDEIIASVGGEGKYQKMLFFIYIGPLHALASLMVLIQIFQVATPDHWCTVPGRPENISINTWREMTVPKKSEGAGFSSCQQYGSIKWDLEDSKLPDIIDCQEGWTFDNTSYDYTIVTENEWVCDRKYYAAQWISISLLGSVAGVLIFNNLADRIGRKPVVLMTTLLFGTFGTIRIFVRHRWMLNTAMFISSMSVPAVADISYILVMEQVSPLYRATATCVTFALWIVGMCLVPLIAWLTKNWVSLGLVTSGLSLLHIPIQWYFSESPRWLACNGKISDAAKVLKNIAKINGKAVPCGIEDKLKLYEKPKCSGDYGRETMQLFQYPRIRIRTILITISYSCISVVYFGLLYNNENMVGNPFVNFFLFAIAEVPSCFLGYLSSNWLGRRLTGSLYQILTTLFIVASVLIHGTSQAWSAGILIIAKGVINVSFFSIYMQYVELYPTSHRSTGTGVSTVVGYIVSTAIPYIVQTNSYWSQLPSIIFASFSIVGAIAAHMLPETLGRNLPQIIDDIEHGFDHQPFWKYQGKELPLLRKKTPSLKKDQEIQSNTLL